MNVLLLHKHKSVKKFNVAPKCYLTPLQNYFLATSQEKIIYTVICGRWVLSKFT